MAKYIIKLDKRIDYEGEYDVLNHTLAGLGVGVIPLLVDRKGDYVFSEDINADFTYRTGYEYGDDGEVTGTNIQILNFTLCLPIKAEIASRANFLIQEQDDWSTLKESSHDIIYYSNKNEPRTELNILFDLEALEDGSKEYIEYLISRDISKLVELLYEATKEGDSKDE